MKYDNRNLLIEMNLIKASNDPNSETGDLYKLIFDYDEAGNRVRKREYYYQGQQQINPGTGDNNGGTNGTNGDNLGGDWNLVGDEYYSRDVSGKEIAIYHSYDLYQWNVWGTDNAGKITANGDKFFYLKDHLGTIRVVLDASNNIVSANDYDPWGYPLENRSFQSDNTDYKFTGKQRDKESGYDYFGARYYDARVGRWGGVEPLLEKYFSYTPYQYGLLNPMRLVDANGKDVYITGTDATNTVNAMNKSATGDFKVMIDPKTNKLSCTGTGKTKMEGLIKFAIENENVKVNLITTRDNKYNGEYFATGMYYGSKTIDGVENTYQIFNIKHAEKYEEAGGSSVGESAMHEIGESFMGGMIFENPGTGYNSDRRDKLHSFIESDIEEEQYYPKQDQEGNIYGYYDEKNNFIPLYDFKTGKTVYQIKK